MSLPKFQSIQEEISNMLDVPDEELTDEQKAIMNQYLDELGQQEAGKIDAFASFVKLETSRIEACKIESRRLANKAKAAENRIEWLKTHYLVVMRENGIKKIQGDVYAVSIRESQKVAVNDFEALKKFDDPAYIRVKTIEEPNRETIKEALKGGLAIPGCALEKSASLQIR